MTYYSCQVQRIRGAFYPKSDLCERIVRAKQFMDRHHADSPDLNAICAEACLSKYHFIRLFRRLYGRTPHQYLCELRIAKAKALIGAGMTVRDTCAAVGYDSVTSFSSLFKKTVGTAPSRLGQKSNFR